MILRAKILLLWLLALAIPVQGFAAVLQVGCTPASMSTAAPATMHTMPGGQQMQGMQHDHDDMKMAGQASSDHGKSHHTSHQSGSSCSSCATCNVGAVLPLALADLPAPDLPSPEYLARPATGFVGFTPENPDRPPAFA